MANNRDVVCECGRLCALINVRILVHGSHYKHIRANEKWPNAIVYIEATIGHTEIKFLRVIILDSRLEATRIFSMQAQHCV